MSERQYKLGFVLVRYRMTLLSEVRTLAAAVQAQLSSDILAGRFLPGSRLRLASLTKEYKVGMSPVREALAHLAGQGLVLQEGQRGFRVAPVSIADLSDLSSTRTLLETTALRLSIQNGGARWEAELLAAHHCLARHPRSAEKLVDEEWEALHRTFHLKLIEACGLRYLLASCSVVYDQFDRYRRVAVRAARRHPRVKDVHQLLTDAALKKKADAAVNLLSEHIRDAEAQILVLGDSVLFSKSLTPEPARIMQPNAAMLASG